MELKIIGKEILVDQSPILYNRPFSAQTLAADWQVRNGSWQVEGEWLTGKNPENAPGMVVSRAGYPGNVLLDFEARTVLPCTHDIDVMWNGSWNEATNTRGTAYVAGLEGWWEGKVGLEKSPEYKLNAATSLFDFTPGRTYRLRVGSIDGHCFVFVDNALALELTDTDPIDHTRHTLIGFEAYCSHIQIRNLVVRSIVWQPRVLKYTPEF